jgi:hypothetical protein
VCNASISFVRPCPLFEIAAGSHSLSDSPHNTSLPHRDVCGILLNAQLRLTLWSFKTRVKPAMSFLGFRTKFDCNAVRFGSSQAVENYLVAANQIHKDTFRNHKVNAYVPTRRDSARPSEIVMKCLKSEVIEMDVGHKV